MSTFNASYDPGPSISHAGGINIGTPDLEKSLWFFRDLLGMEVTAQSENVAYLRGYQERVHHSLTLTRQAESAVNSLSFRVSRPQDVELFYERIKAGEETEAVEVEASSEAGRGTAVRFLVPGSNHPFELYYDIDKPEGDPALRSMLKDNVTRRRGVGVQRLDHLNISTSSATIVQSERWMREELGMKRREYASSGEPDSLFVSWLSVNSKLHDIAIGANDNDGDGRFHHVAFHLNNYHDLLTAAELLRDQGIQIDAGPGVHGIGQAMYLYVRDPGSGHRIELYSGGIPFFDPDWESIHWTLEDMGFGMTWVGDLPDLNPETSTYVPTTAMSGLEFNRSGESS